MPTIINFVWVDDEVYNLMYLEHFNKHCSFNEQNKHLIILGNLESQISVGAIEFARTCDVTIACAHFS